MAAKPVKIAILADAKDAVKGFDKAGAAAKDAGSKFDGAADGADTLASKGAQAGGALNGLGDLIGGKFGGAMAVAGTAMTAAGDAGDLLNAAMDGGKRLATQAAAAAQALGKAETYSSAAKKVSAAAQWALNAAMSANPIGLIILAIVALVAAFVIAYKKSETFRKIVNGAWTKIKAVGIAVFNFLKGFISGAFQFIKNAFLRYTPLGIIISNFSRIKSFIVGAWNAVKAATSRVWAGIKSAVSGAINSLMSTVRGIKSRVTGIFSGAGSWLTSAGRRVIQGLLDGIDRMIQRVRDKLSYLTNLIPDWKGPASKDAKLLRGAGELIIQGLVDGFDRKIPKVKKSLTGLTKTIGGFTADGYNVSLSAAGAYASSGGSGGAGTVYQITVQAPVGSSSADIGRALVSHIESYERAGGRRRA